MTREDVLKEARKCVCGQRQEDYGTPENNFETIGLLWSVYLRAAHSNINLAINGISAKDVAVMMSLLKVARSAKSNKADNFINLAGYAACAGEIATRHDNPQLKSNSNTCVCCGAIIPEGRQVCAKCETSEVEDTR